MSDQRRQSELPGFPCLLVASVVARCASAEAQEPKVHCCYWEAGCWSGLGQSACLKAAATAVSLCWAQSPLCSTHSDEQKPTCCTQSWTDTHKRMHTHWSSNARPSSTATPSLHCCHSFFTIQNSTHGLFSVGIIIIHYLDRSSYYCLNCLTAHFIWEGWDG